MEDERVLKVRIECRSFWESGKNRSNPMIGNDCSLYSTIPRVNWRIKYESSSWHLSEREGFLGFDLLAFHVPSCFFNFLLAWCCCVPLMFQLLVVEFGLQSYSCRWIVKFVALRDLWH
ncbi:uncharacterized protein LOC127128835 [Lathyrus oleraceus]|uniref:uncharacterized protein LOC127128835 n=1 Tax=Pisum sativum TaxID=3888 RepID=UPI0021CE6BEE|nr:uncharacterized protein LOC127128835 [Pisum sativum]